jgi:predicted PurR-regulated permease PerM
VILLGAIGGMIVSGVIGLFTGAVILAIGYKFFIDWVDEARPADDPVEPDQAGG